MNPSWPFASVDLPAVAASYKRRVEDFRVVELAAYEPRDEGTHVFFEIEKSGLSTLEAVRRIAQALGLGPREIGFAGLKDARAVTRQMLSVEHVELERVRALEVTGVRVLSARLHGNKLRVGHLAGNRFELRLRDVERGDAERVRAVLDFLARCGVPNYFGEQRFGIRGDTWRVGRALLLGDHADAAAWIAGRPGPVDHGRVRRARELFDAGDYGTAARTWPGNFRDHVRLCAAMAKKRGDARRALHAVDRGVLRLNVAAYQAWLFNQVVAERIGGLGRLEVGDLAWKHENGAVFEVVDTALEQPRADAFEISPSGPLFGRRIKLATGRPGERELAVLARAGHTLDDFAQRGALEWQGARRPLRFPLGEWRVEAGDDEHGPYVELAFTLPPGCYATSVVREVLKQDASVEDAQGAVTTS